MVQQTQSVGFPGASGATLAARLEVPAERPRAYALFAHCFTCSKDTKAATYISTALAERGIAVLRFDFTGLGGSEGDFANTNFSSNIGDLVAAANFLRKTYRAPAVLIGHSLGGTAMLAAAQKIPETLAVATIGSPYDPDHVLRLLKDSLGAIQAEGEALVDIAGARVLHQEAVSGRHPGTQARRHRSAAGKSADGDALAARYHRRHRQRRENIHGREAPQEFRLARPRGPPPVAPRRCVLRRPTACRVGRALPGRETERDSCA